MSTTSRFLILTNSVTINAMAGLLFAFASCVMPSLRELPAQHGLATMQRVNKFIVTPLFVILFLGSVAGSLALAAQSLRSGAGVPVQAIVGSGLYLSGFFLVTVVVHLPLNGAIDQLRFENPADAQRWPALCQRWVRFNIVRTVAALAAGVVMCSSLWPQ